MYIISDFWTLARPKLPEPHKYYGSYPAGFLERARPILGCNHIDTDSILHVCSGHVHHYNDSVGVKLSGFGKSDICLDIDEGTNPNIVGDASHLHLAKNSRNGLMFPLLHFRPKRIEKFLEFNNENPAYFVVPRPRAILIDRPYTELDAQHYKTGNFPNLSALVSYCLHLSPKHGLVGILDYEWAKPKGLKQGEDYRTYATIGVSCGENNKARNFIVFQRL